MVDIYTTWRFQAAAIVLATAGLAEIAYGINSFVTNGSSTVGLFGALIKQYAPQYSTVPGFSGVLDTTLGIVMLYSALALWHK